MCPSYSCCPQVSTTLALTVDQFYDTRSLFLQSLAFLLGIDLTRLQIVSIVPGSAVVKYLVYDDPRTVEQTIPERSYNTGVTMDAETGVGAVLAH